MNGPAKKLGRPPGPHGDTLSKLIPVALELFLTEGGAALTPTRLHNETGVARATIYRNWPDPADLIEIMLEYATEQPAPDSFTGDLGADLHVAVDVLLDRFEKRPARAFFAACMEYGRHSERVATAAEAFIAGILDPFRTVVDQAISDGVLEGDSHDLVSEIAGPLILEHVVMGRPVSRARGRHVANQFLRNHQPGTKT